MVNTADSFKINAPLIRAAILGALTVAFGSVAMAQSQSSSTNAPDLPNTVAIPPKPYRGPPPIVMFRAVPASSPSVPKVDTRAIQFVPPPPQSPPPQLPTGLAQVDTSQRRYSIANTAERDAVNAGWDPASLDAVVAPPTVSGPQVSAVAPQPVYLTPPNAERAYRGPMRRILQDTGRSITRDLPEAVADALPWVDRDAKNEPFNSVLERVAEDLHRAAQGDPEWALPAQREIRALSQRLDLLSAPPVLAQANDDIRPVSVTGGVDDRPFRPRPIWPGAAGRPETQVRPVTLVTSTGQQSGPATSGVTGSYVRTVDDDDGMPTAQPAPRRRTGARGVPNARPAVKSR